MSGSKSRRSELAERLRLTLVVSQAEAQPRSVEQLAELAFAGGVTALQLREKKLPGGELYRSALALARFCRERGRLFIVNDRLDIALASDADGLHLGQTDLPLEAAAAHWPKSKILGLSAALESQAQAGLAAGADYIGVGAIFATGSKTDAPTADRRQAAAVVALGAPTVAIGGLTVDNAAEIWRLGFAGLAVISALTTASDPTDTARRLLAARP
ncbi:MAG: thiamine phosphate synthase [Deltaproteobacteria bacterium]|jgi:thiamine-phosphate pyrophosphorylase|nr:thiamine phosphate synthase [Deltaproteobacteria bacterium]